MIIIPKYAQEALQKATILPTEVCVSTEAKNVAKHAAKLVKKHFKADRVEVVTEDCSDRHDPIRKRLEITLKRPESKDLSFKMDVFMAVFMAEKVASEHFSRPFARNLDGDLHPICYPRSYSTAKKLASLVYKELYPGNPRRFSHVDGDVTNLCNWNIVPKPYVSHVNMVRRDGHTWYIKLEDHKGNYRIEAGSEEALLAIMKYRRDEFRGMLLDVSPRDLGHSLHGNDISMVTWYGHLDRMKAWSPTGDLEPYCQPLA